MASILNSGVGLEARVQRLFLAQRVFAERHLFPAASPDHRMLAIDIDVLVSEYASGFNVTKRHAHATILLQQGVHLRLFKSVSGTALSPQH